MSHRELAGRELENYWRERLETALARYQRSLCPEEAVDRPDDQAREQARALEEYVSVLQRFTEIVIHGAYPAEPKD